MMCSQPRTLVRPSMCSSRRSAIDVLFSDVVMPGGMNGVELAREARRMRPAMKLLLASGYPMSALIIPT